MRLLQFSALALCICAALTVNAEVRLPNASSDHVVLQRERPIHIWGWATSQSTSHGTLPRATVIR